MENSYRRTIRNLNTDESAQANKSSLEEDQTVKNDERKSVRKNLKRFDYLYFQESSVCTNKQWLGNLESRQRRLTTGLNLRGRSDRDNLESEQLLINKTYSIDLWRIGVVSTFRNSHRSRISIDMRLCTAI
jgi:hypothetical protein